MTPFLAGFRSELVKLAAIIRPFDADRNLKPYQQSMASTLKKVQNPKPAKGATPTDFVTPTAVRNAPPNPLTSPNRLVEY